MLLEKHAHIELLLLDLSKRGWHRFLDQYGVHLGIGICLSSIWFKSFLLLLEATDLLEGKNGRDIWHHDN